MPKPNADPFFHDVASIALFCLSDNIVNKVFLIMYASLNLYLFARPAENQSSDWRGHRA